MATMDDDPVPIEMDSNGDEEVAEIDSMPVQKTATPLKRQRKLTSNVWEHYEFLQPSEDALVAMEHNLDDLCGDVMSMNLSDEGKTSVVSKSEAGSGVGQKSRADGNGVCREGEEKADGLGLWLSMPRSKGTDDSSVRVAGDDVGWRNESRRMGLGKKQGTGNGILGLGISHFGVALALGAFYFAHCRAPKVGPKSIALARHVLLGATTYLGCPMAQVPD
ncbi:hypothetical protein Cgig2_033606 [Carnegiea gigantea]|uniref:Uncharacterized protein n=1 Tax=Carnegiea gigantea TaxID=171969 RepID=A0A9Q1KPI1_9CARY|nr:hypothetical protein Cgig2_033606 [Carnegiea gigantea]